MGSEHVLRQCGKIFKVDRDNLYMFQDNLEDIQDKLCNISRRVDKIVFRVAASTEKHKTKPMKCKSEIEQI